MSLAISRYHTSFQIIRNFVLSLTVSLTSAANAKVLEGHENFESTLGAEIIVQGVIAGDLLPDSMQKRHQLVRLKALLAGGNDRVNVELRDISCEKSLGTWDCQLLIWSRINNADGIEKLTVQIFQGKLLAATMENDGE